MVGILIAEDANESYIHLYRAGNYWEAFEVSAFNLVATHADVSVIPIMLLTMPRPIVMASIEASYLIQAVRNLECVNSCGEARTYRLTKKVDLSAYKKWHTEEVKFLADYAAGKHVDGMRNS